MELLKQGTFLQDGKYRIIRVLGQGGFGITYLAEHTMLDKQIAIKEFFPKEYCNRDECNSHVSIGSLNSKELVAQLKSKFIKEAKNISKLNHPNIITIHDIFQENDTAYYVMEYVEGNSLSEIINQRGALPECEAIIYIRKIADAVGYMHSVSMNHLDLKPANIMVRKKDGEPILIDFGLSKQYDAGGGQTSTTPIGISHGFAPIEQYRPGGVATFSPQTDIYALGATLLNLLTGSVPPYYSDILEDGFPELPTSISRNTALAVEHAMEIKKNKRPQTVQIFISELCPDSEDATIGEESKESIIQGKEAEDKTPETFAQNEETKLISDEIINKSREVAIPRKIATEKNTTIYGIEFVDLGLSVQWATKNIGASRPSDFGDFFDREVMEDSKKILDLRMNGCQVPTISQWEELKNECIWERTELNDIGGYKIHGTNGNWIFLPFSGEYSGFGFSSFGRLYTHEAFFPNYIDTYFYYFYFSNRGTYKPTKYSLAYRCPIRLIHQSK